MIIHLFIGSATESLEVAEAFKRRLEHDFHSANDTLEAELWNEQPGVGSFQLDGLRQKVDQSDFAVLVADGIDTLTSRGLRPPTCNAR